MPTTDAIRTAHPSDHPAIVDVVDEWWGGRQMAALLQPLFLENFSSTSLVAETPSGELIGFLVGFVSGDDPTAAYVHFAGVSPAHRCSGLGRMLYARFDAVVGVRGVGTVRCVTSSVNTASVAFHRAIGFTIDGAKADAGIDGGKYVQMARAVTPPKMPPMGGAEPTH